MLFSTDNPLLLAYVLSSTWAYQALIFHKIIQNLGISILCRMMVFVVVVKLEVYKRPCMFWCGHFSRSDDV